MDLPTETRRKPARFARLFRLPSFSVALCISLAALLGFITWIIVDASFSSMLWFVGLDLGLIDDPGFERYWGLRRVLFIALVAVATAATLVVFYRTLFGSRQSRSLRAMFIAIALVAAWLTFFASYSELKSFGSRWRLHRAMDGLKRDAEVLLAKWPTTAGRLPFLGKYSVMPSETRVLILNASSKNYGMNEVVGPCITRLDDGGIAFEYERAQVEFHPHGNTPSSFVAGDQHGFSVRYALDHYRDLEPGWFLAVYSVEYEAQRSAVVPDSGKATLQNPKTSTPIPTELEWR